MSNYHDLKSSLQKSLLRRNERQSRPWIVIGLHKQHLKPPQMYCFVSGSLCFYSSCVFCLALSSGFINLSLFLIAKGHSIRVHWRTWKKSDIYWWGAQSNSCCRYFMNFSQREPRHLLWCRGMDWLQSHSIQNTTWIFGVHQICIFSRACYRDGFLVTKSGKFLSQTLFTLGP